MALTAIVAGSSGLIGSNLIPLLLANPNYSNVIAVGRRKIETSNPKLTQFTTSFDTLEEIKEELKGDVFFYCLGTTKSKTPDVNRYKTIELGYPTKAAQLSAENKVSQFHFISSLGADSKSANAYLRLKGKAEEAIQQLEFKSVHCYRPSVLKGNRKEFRMFERLFVGLMGIINPILTGKFKKYRSIDAELVAKAMVNQSLKNSLGIHVYESDQIRELA